MGTGTSSGRRSRIGQWQAAAVNDGWEDGCRQQRQATAASGEGRQTAAGGDVEQQRTMAAAGSWEGALQRMTAARR